MKNIMITEFDAINLLKITHYLEDKVSAVSLFSHENGETVEITPGHFSPEIEGKIISSVYDRKATEEELSLAHDILEEKDKYVLSRVYDTIEAIGGTTLLRLIELGGRHYAYTSVTNTMYTRLAEIQLTPEELPVMLEEVPASHLPYIVANLSGTLLAENKRAITIQFGEGLFIHLKRLNKEVYATVLALESVNSQESKLSTKIGFVLEKYKDEWFFKSNEDMDSSNTQKQIKKAYEHVLNELSQAI